MKKLYALLVVTIVFLSTSPSSFAGTSLFPSALRTSEWLTFDAAGFSKPVCGVVYRKDNLVTNGMPLGGIDTGCIDLETSGLLGYCTIFNTLVPRRGPLNVPILGISVGGKTWVLCDKQIKKGKGPYQLEVEPGLTELELEGVETVKDIRYWGHYPVADLEFETTAPVSVGLRAWSPFLPGDVKGSMIPGIVFEVHLRNTSGSAQKGALAFSFPGPTANEAGTSKFERKDIRGKLAGVEIGCANMSYALGVIDGKKVRFGGELGADGSAWANIEKALPGSQPDKAGASSAVDFSLAPGQEEVVRFVLTWHAPTWEGGGFNWVKSPVEGTPIVPTIGYTPMGNIFHHMYAKYYPNAAKTAQLLADQHAALLERILAWQQVVYTAKELPIWLRESLVNVLHLITECALWAQARAPIPSWATEDEGLFGLNECDLTP